MKFLLHLILDISLRCGSLGIILLEKQLDGLHLVFFVCLFVFSSVDFEQIPH